MAFISYEKKGRIVFITLNRPEKLNAVNTEMANELADRWVEFRDDENSWVAVLSGAGRSFCAGGDIGSEDPRARAILNRHNMIWTRPSVVGSPITYKVWKPIIAALHGHTLGVGLWFALQCDMRIAAEDTKIGLPEPRGGIATVFAGVLPRYVPYGMASELLLTGGSIDAHRAFEMCLVNKVVPYEQLMPAATMLAERMCEISPTAVRIMKQLLQEGRDEDFYTSTSLFDSVGHIHFKSKDYEEAIIALQEKRKPAWQGR